MKISRLDGTAALFGPAPQTAFDAARPVEHLFVSLFPQDFVSEPDVEAKITREQKFDPDLWLIEVEDRAGRHFLNLASS